MELNDKIFEKFLSRKKEIKNISKIDISSKVICKNSTEYLLSTSIHTDNLCLPDFDFFKKNYINTLELIYGIREKKSKKLCKQGIDSLLKAGEINCFKDEVEKILSALNSDFENLKNTLKTRFSCSHKLFFLLLSYFKKQDLLFIDIETKNLFSESIIITIGLGYFENEKFIVRQFTILKDAAEYEILNEASKYFENKKAVITFNGKTFDIPFLENRLSYYSIEHQDIGCLFNFDLFHFSKNAFKNELNSFSLKDIEKYILKKQRKNDIPSDEVDFYYSSYLKTGDIRYLNTIIYHNLEDIKGMYLIFKKICEKWIK